MSVRKGVVCVIYTKDAASSTQTTKGRQSPVLFLVLHRVFLWKGWEFVKGGVEKEDITEEITVRREIEEETGLKKIRIGQRLDYVIKYKYKKANAREPNFTETEQSVFIVNSLEKDVKLPVYGDVKEHDDFRWLEYEKARKLLTHTQQRKALDIAWRILRDQVKP